VLAVTRRHIISATRETINFLEVRQPLRGPVAGKPSDRRHSHDSNYAENKEMVDALDHLSDIASVLNRAVVLEWVLLASEGKAISSYFH